MGKISHIPKRLSKMMSPKVAKEKLNAADPEGKRTTALQSAWRGKAARNDQRAKTRKATYIQKIWRGKAAKNANALNAVQAEKATFLQSVWRGKAARDEIRDYNSFIHSASGRRLGETEQQVKLRLKMASILYPSRTAEERAALLEKIETALEDAAPGYAEPQAEDTSETQAEAARERAEAIRIATEAGSDAAAKAAIAIQAKVRGLLARQHTEAGVEESTASAPAGKARSTLQLALVVLGAVALCVVLLALCYALFLYVPAIAVAILTFAGKLAFLLVCILILAVSLFYAWLRFPYWLGDLLSHIVTNIPLHTCVHAHNAPRRSSHGVHAR